MVRVRLGDLKDVIREEYLRGVPEFVLREEVRKMSGGIRQHIKRHIEATKNNPVTQREALSALNDVLQELEDEAFEVVQNKIWQFMQRT